MADNKHPVPIHDPFVEIGSTGLKESGGWVMEEWHPRLQGRRGVEAYIEMRDNDPLVGGFLLSIETSARGVPWPVKPADEDDALSMDAAKFLRECMDDMSFSWTDFIAEAFTMIPFGWSYFEDVFKIRRGPNQKNPRFRSKFNDGKIGWRKFGVRSQETLWNWEFDIDGGIQGMWQWDPYTRKSGNAFIPIQKATLFRTTSAKNNPEGRSMLRNAFIAYRYIKQFRKIEGIGIERELAGLPVFFVPAEFLTDSATPEQKATVAMYKKIAQQIRADERGGLVLANPLDVDGNPSGFDAKLWTTGGRRAIDVGGAIERWEKRMTVSWLHDWLLLGQDKIGTQALADSKTGVSARTMGALLDIVADTLNRITIPRLFRMNPEFPPETWPTIEHGDIESRDLEQMANFFSKIWPALGLEGGPSLERFLLAQVGGPEPEEQREFPERFVGVKKEEVEDVYTAAQASTLASIMKDVAAGKIPMEAGITLSAMTLPISKEDARSLFNEAVKTVKEGDNA